MKHPVTGQEAKSKSETHEIPFEMAFFTVRMTEHQKQAAQGGCGVSVKY